ncbi:Fic family protein [Rhizobium daejeonense]|uniref:Fic family protein n=1 Tax=Rhizobium daejeonense TaxID=240521 RepID=A0A6M1S238_9HYPH|nr:Fic family protein [Rhizobium daejeonense]NGO65339.1 Fic family protein [Rhizobium daejeonense]
MLKPSYQLPDLTSLAGLETIEIFKALATANRSLAELKGRAAAIPNQGILIDTLALQEAKASSEIENIVTTQDELFQAELFPEGLESPAAKEVALYRDALKFGFDKLRQTDGLITNATIVGMFQLLKRRTDGFRQTPGTALKNDRSGEIVYVPPQDQREINAAMSELERFINDDQRSTLDPLIKMALIHHQFESIHPFPDGNGRIGRILNVLYLTRVELLEIPILYLSRAINNSKSEYYRLLQHVRDTGEWEDWLVYILKAVDETARTTLDLVENIRGQMASAKKRLRDELPKLYSQDLLNNLFRHPYTRIDFVQNELGITRQTAAKYLDTLAERGFLTKHQSGRNNYYINAPLVALFLKVSE